MNLGSMPFILISDFYLNKSSICIVMLESSSLLQFLLKSSRMLKGLLKRWMFSLMLWRKKMICKEELYTQIKTFLNCI